MAMAEAVTPMTPQRYAALQRGQAIRMWRAEQKKSMTWEKAQAWIAEPPEPAEGMKVGQLLVTIYRVGPTKRDELLRKAGVSHRTTLGDLTDRQRRALLDLMA